jgi:hypothetical protein
MWHQNIITILYDGAYRCSVPEAILQSVNMSAESNRPLGFRFSEVCSFTKLWNHSSSVNTVIKLRAGWAGFDSGKELENFLFATQFPNLWILGFLSPGVLTAHIYLVSRLRMRGAVPYPQYVFMAWLLGKNKDNLTFYLYIATFQRSTDERSR